jgi:hypothetical protein
MSRRRAALRCHDDHCRATRRGGRCRGRCRPVAHPFASTRDGQTARHGGASASRPGGTDGSVSPPFTGPLRGGSQ